MISAFLLKVMCLDWQTTTAKASFFLYIDIFAALTRKKEALQANVATKHHKVMTHTHTAGQMTVSHRLEEQTLNSHATFDVFDWDKMGWSMGESELP